MIGNLEMDMGDQMGDQEIKAFHTWSKQSANNMCHLKGNHHRKLRKSASF